MEDEERTLVVLEWQDRWINTLDDVFLDGATLLDHTVAYSAENLPKDSSGRPRAVGEVVDERIQDWRTVVVQPHVHMAWVELGRKTGRALPPPALPDTPSLANPEPAWFRTSSATITHWRDQAKLVTITGTNSLRERVLELVKREAQATLATEGHHA